MYRHVKFKPNQSIEPCPKCKNNTEFTAHSAQVCEDGCEVWVVCQCGYDPTQGNSSDRLEDVWGGTGNDNVLNALSIWNDLIFENQSQEAKP